MIAEVVQVLMGTVGSPEPVVVGPGVVYTAEEPGGVDRIHWVQGIVHQGACIGDYWVEDIDCFVVVRLDCTVVACLIEIRKKYFICNNPNTIYKCYPCETLYHICNIHDK